MTDKMAEKESEIFALISQNKFVTQNEMAKKFGASRKTISGHLKSLKDKGLIRRAGSDTKGHWEIRVTDKFTDEITERMTEKESEIFALISQHKSVTRNEMAKKLGAAEKLSLGT
jgi:predicted HTH transcriptional regulator